MKDNQKWVELYKSSDGEVQLQVQLEEETVWLTQADLSYLFDTDRSAITKHIRNIFNSNELQKKQVCAKFAHTASDGKTYQTNFYNLDAVISVGYRVNSKRGTEFRIWATNTLRQHLVKGYTANERRLSQLKQSIKLIADISTRKELTSSEATALLQTVSQYAYALDLLDDYDHQRVTLRNTTIRQTEPVDYEEATELISQMKQNYSESDIFGKEKDKSLHSSLQSIMQTFGGQDLYPSVEEKAANLLYFLVKNHSFVDGNKRIAATIFLRFAEKNNLIYDEHRNRRIADNALVAMTLMIAESERTEKEVITVMLANLIAGK